MNNLKKFYSIAMLFSMLLLVSCTPEVASEVLNKPQTMLIMADFLDYNSIEHLALNATDVIRGEVLDERVERINIWTPPQSELEVTGDYSEEAYHTYTIYRLKVLEVFQGNAEIVEIIEFKQLGGQLGDINYISYDEMSIRIDDDFVLFLQSFDRDDIPASLLNPTQSAYRFKTSVEDARYRSVNATLESVNVQNDLTLTLDDLLQISEG